MAYSNTKTIEGSQVDFPMAADAVFEGGEIVIIDAGYADLGKVATGLYAPGIALRPKDNTGGNDGDQVVTVEMGFGPKGIRIHKLKNDTGGTPIVAADVGVNDCYVIGPNKVSGDSSGASKAGKVMRLFADGDVGVWFNQ